MKLYYTPGACSLSAHIALREAGLDFELEKVDLKAKTTETGADYLAINPKGYVPTLKLDDGQVLTEASVIAQYVADLRPRRHLAPPPKTMERYRVMEWMNFISSEVHKQFTPMFNPNCSAELRQSQIEKLGPRFDYLAKALGGKTYLMGEQFTIADGYLFNILSWTSFVNIDMSRWPVLQEYMKRVASRTAVKKALKAEGLYKKK